MTHWQEIEGLMQQIYSANCKVDLNYGLPDLSTALRQIQTQYDSIAAKNLLVGSLLIWLSAHIVRLR